MSSEKLTLTCLVWPVEQPDQRLVLIEIENNKTIASLKDVVKLKYLRKLDAVDVSHLNLWKCSIPIDGHLEENLKNTRFDHSNTGLLLLSPMLKISEYFATGLPEKTIIILVELPEYLG